MATRKTANKEKALTDADVFKKFGVGPNQKSLRKFISGQRKINGRLYKAIELILDALPKESAPSSLPDFEKLVEAGKINEVIPGDPPGCNDKGLGTPVGGGT